MTKKNEWFQTDSFQWCRRVDDDGMIWQFVEIGYMDVRGCYSVREETIDMREILKDEGAFTFCLHTYGYSDLAELQEEYGDDAMQIAAELVFEDKITVSSLAHTKAEAVRAVRELMRS